MTPNTKQLAAELLDLAADEFGNHGCNDFELADTPENRAFVRAMNLFEGVEDEDADWLNMSNGKIIIGDDSAMRFLASVLRESAKAR